MVEPLRHKLGSQIQLRVKTLRTLKGRYFCMVFRDQLHLTLGETNYVVSLFENKGPNITLHPVTNRIFYTIGSGIQQRNNDTIHPFGIRKNLPG